jgi:hypothetical protein
LLHDCPQSACDFFIRILLDRFVFEPSSFGRFSIVKFFIAGESLKHFFQGLEADEEATSCEEQETDKAYQ